MLHRPIEPKQFTSIRYGERLAEIGATPSIGTVGDSYDNALAETVNGYYMTELVRGPARPGPWRTVEDLELATLGWVHWHDTQRLHGYPRLRALHFTPFQFPGWAVWSARRRAASAAYGASTWTS